MLQVSNTYLKAHIVDTGLPASAKKDKASFDALHTAVRPRVEEQNGSVLLLLQPATVMLCCLIYCTLCTSLWNG